MPEIRHVWQRMQHMFPSYFKSPGKLHTLLKITDPTRITAKLTQNKKINITAAVQFKPKKTLNINTLIEVDGLTMSSHADIDFALFSSKKGDQATIEIVKSLFLCDLIALGIFTQPIKREAFKLLTKLEI